MSTCVCDYSYLHVYSCMFKGGHKILLTTVQPFSFKVLLNLGFRRLIFESTVFPHSHIY